MMPHQWGLTALPSGQYKGLDEHKGARFGMSRPRLLTFALADVVVIAVGCTKVHFAPADVVPSVVGCTKVNFAPANMVLFAVGCTKVHFSPLQIPRKGFANSPIPKGSLLSVGGPCSPKASCKPACN